MIKKLTFILLFSIILFIIACGTDAPLEELNKLNRLLQTDISTAQKIEDDDSRTEALQDIYTYYLNKVQNIDISEFEFEFGQCDGLNDYIEITNAYFTEATVFNMPKEVRLRLAIDFKVNAESLVKDYQFHDADTGFIKNTIKFTANFFNRQSLDEYDSMSDQEYISMLMESGQTFFDMNTFTDLAIDECLEIYGCHSVAECYEMGVCFYYAPLIIEDKIFPDIDPNSRLENDILYSEIDNRWLDLFDENLSKGDTGTLYVWIDPKTAAKLSLIDVCFSIKPFGPFEYDPNAAFPDSDIEPDTNIDDEGFYDVSNLFSDAGGSSEISNETDASFDNEGFYDVSNLFGDTGEDTAAETDESLDDEGFPDVSDMFGDE